jgi:hypothetical protein
MMENLRGFSTDVPNVKVSSQAKITEPSQDTKPVESTKRKGHTNRTGPRFQCIHPRMPLM